MRRDDDWNHYRYVYGEGREATIHFDVGCALQPAPDTHGTCVRLVVRGDSEGFLAHLERTLAPIDCWFVGEIHYPGTTTFVLQVEAAAAFDAALPVLQQAVETLEVERSAGWGYFDERVCPNEVDWQRIADREQCERLARDGVDLDTVRPVAHGFYADAARLERIEQRLLTEGLTVAERSDERLVMLREHRLCDVSEVSVALARFARSVGAAYDGWRPFDL